MAIKFTERDKARAKEEKRINKIVAKHGEGRDYDGERYNPGHERMSGRGNYSGPSPKKANKKMKNEDMGTTRRIIEILASASPEHSLKEAVAAALSERVTDALNEYKQRVAESYFGQADLVAEENLDEVTYSPAAKATQKIERRWAKKAAKRPSKEPVDGKHLAFTSRMMGHGKDSKSYENKMDAYWKERKARGSYGPGAGADRVSDRRYATIQRQTKARYDSRGFDKSKNEDLQELSKHTLGSYIKKASHDVTHKGAQTREMANRAQAERKAQNYVGARKASDLSDKIFDKSWNRRKNMAKAVDRLTKEALDEAAKKQATIAQKNKAIKAFDKAGKYRPDSKLRYAPLKFKKDRKSAREMSQARYNSSPESEAYWSS